MSLPKTPNIQSAKSRHIQALIFPIAVLGVILLVIILGFVFPKLSQNKPKAKKEVSATKPIKVKTASGETITVPPEVLQITPDQLKSWIDRKENILIVWVTSGDVSRELRIKGSLIVPKENFEHSTNNLTAKTTNVFVSSDGSDSALAIVKLIHLGLPREKNFNLEGGLEAWKQKGYPVEI